jgi:hypothetical protein
MGISPNRLVAVLTPLVFAPLAGAVSALAAKHLGSDLDAAQVQQVFIAGALIAFAKAGLWLKGWQHWEQSQGAVADAPDELPELEDEAEDELVLADAEPDPDLDDEDEEQHENGYAMSWSD